MPTKKHKRISSLKNGNKKWELDHKKRVVYTCITGNKGYKLREPLHENPKWDFICFTDNPKLKSKRWEIRPMKRLGLDDAKLSRRPKILFHEYLPEYLYTLWLDTRFTVKINLDKFIGNSIHSSFVVMRHNKRRCLYDEAKVLGISNSKQIRKYAASGMPSNYGLYAPGIMFRRGDNIDVINMCRLWWDEVKNSSHRDIPPLAYALWKNEVPMRTWYFKTTYELFMDRKNPR